MDCLMLGSRNWGLWYNDGSATIAPFECFAVKRTIREAEEIVVYGEQPSSTVRKTYLVNGPFPCEPGKYSQYQSGVEVQFAYDTGTPAEGDQYGWKAGQGTLVKDSNPFITVMGVVRADTKIAIGRITVSGHAVDQFYNDSGETVPVCAVMAVTGIHTLDDGTVIPKIGKPSATFCRSYLFNGATEVPVADAEADPPTTGIGTHQDSDFRDVLALYDTGTPAVNEEWGPKPGQWSLSKNYPSIFTVYGVANEAAKVAFGRVHEATISPMEVLLQWINQSAYTQTVNVSSSNPISARVSTPYVGTAAAAALEILTVSAYNDPCMKVNLAGLWLFTFDISLAAYTITQPPLTGTISTTEGTCSLNNIIQQVAFVPVVITVEKQAAAGGSWTNATTWGSHVYAIGENAGSGNNVLCPKSVLLSLNAGDKLRVRMTAGYENGATATDIVQVSSRLIAHFQP